MASRLPLHPIERKILSALALRQPASWVEISKLGSESQLSIDQVRRGIEWLKAKRLIETEERASQTISLDSDGIRLFQNGLPERRLSNLVKESGGKIELKRAASVMENEFAIALGTAKKNGWLRAEKGTLELEPASEKIEPEEIAIQKIGAKSIAESELGPEEILGVNALEKRKSGIIKKTTEKTVLVRLTPTGAAAAKEATREEIDRITPELLKSGRWRQKPLRELDVTSPAPDIFPGRKHPMRLFMNEVREAFIALGFEEIFGPMAQTALWNFDALFIPQQHSAREMQDTFYISNLKGNLEQDSSSILAIKSAHENGANTGSKGWGYPWSQDEASRVVLRTHTTAVTISYLAKYKPSEARVFSVGRVFRNEKSNYKHNPEFYQIEGVMVGEKLNIRNLIYILSKFYSKLGFNEIKFWPTYFPYTEPSLQTMVFHKPSGRWMELGGMGVFRPEVTLPLGVRNPVLAWGLSLDRLVMLRYGADDIRQLFGANLGWLRKLPIAR